jgi:tetraacyldisaccharide 4'-kinase
MRWCERFLASRYAVCLLPVSWIWGFVSAFRHALYDRGILKIHKVDVPVISVGNIAVGGRGKTPLVILLGKLFSSKRVAILARGYGDGDEMKVIRRHLPYALLYENSNRVDSAKKAIAEGAELLLLDDGFQHRRLHRDFDLVLTHAKDLQGHFLPAGELRDSPRRLGAAIVLPELKIKATCPVSLVGERVGIFCGIAHPERFKKTVTDLGAIIVSEFFLADHEPIGLRRLQQFYKPDMKYLICTEKDEVKLPKTSLPIHSVRIETQIDGLENLIEKIKERLDNQPL